MNAIVPSSPRGLPALPPSGPSISPDLSAAVRRMIEAPDAPPIPITALVKSEAGKALERLDNVLAPMTADILRAWLTPVAMAVRNPPTRGDFEARFAAILAACADLPACACTGTSQREALASFAFWPSAADVRKLLSDACVDQRRKRAALRAIANGREEPAAERRATEDEGRDGFARALAAVGAASAATMRPVTLRHQAPALSRATLAAMYRSAGLPVPGETSPAPMARISSEVA